MSGFRQILMKKTHYQKYKITSQWGISMTTAQAAEATIDSLTYKTAAKSIVYVSNCTNNLEGEIAIPSTVTIKGEKYNVTSIGEQAFADCDLLTNVIIPDSVTSIGDTAFYRCSSLTSVIIGNSVSTIGETAFMSCASLTSITIPNSVIKIGDFTFRNCTSLKKVYFQSKTPPEVGSSIFSKCPSDMIIYYPAGAEQNWINKWHKFSIAPWNPIK